MHALFDGLPSVSPINSCKREILSLNKSHLHFTEEPALAVGGSAAPYLV